MPEGDTLYRIAENVRPVLAGQTIAAALSNASPQVPAIDAQSLVGRVVTTVEARGKHLLITLDDHRVVHSHLGMTGSWHAYRIGDPWRKPPRQAGLALRTATHEVVNFNPKLLKLVTATTLRRNDYLQRLGPDLMLPGVELAAVLPRLRVHNAAPMGEAVMNQTIAAGIGNVYKSETLFICRINPWTLVGELSDLRLTDYLAETHRLMRINRKSGKRTTRFAGDGQRFWVYGRRGEPCFKCETPIRLRRQGDAGRTTYWCPRCQPPAR
ncbi:Endonuclease 8 1 [Posidoniimonas polymericola]|uniref:DNA-(apurinic or apyrimidinic site) lyase n=1 Tax=Posidoniimonas polymericola TaxID=2528002 RepID=A0A5C5YQS2_9BACT|nr:DNA-formamidopyrimidine glycosylase family protein [Posidoniimonas polymericola]TWT77266.1 Endonuclease 8 1 [Posidoniimonas polymericola]